MERDISTSDTFNLSKLSLLLLLYNLIAFIVLIELYQLEVKFVVSSQIFIHFQGQYDAAQKEKEQLEHIQRTDAKMRKAYKEEQAANGNADATATEGH